VLVCGSVSEYFNGDMPSVIRLCETGVLRLH
jgi:hypothetical protein